MTAVASKVSPDIGSLVGGLSVVAGQRQSRAVFDPATGEKTATLWLATEADVDQAAANAQLGFDVWSRMTPLARANILKSVADAMRRDAESMAQMLTSEQGKTIREARGEVAGSADLIEWLAEEGKRVYGRVVSGRSTDVQQLVLLEPVGPVAAFSPWNYPLSLATRKVGHALAAGCSVVIKPAEEAPSAVLHLAKLCIACGVPPDAVQVLFGIPSMISGRLIASPIMRKVSFTGSVAVGQELAALAGRGLKKVTFELGGHSPVIVMDDIDVEKVAALAVTSKYRNAGQICISPTRFMVHEAIYERFVHEFTRRAQALRIGVGMDELTDMGPLAHVRRQDAMRELAEDAVAQGATLKAGDVSTPARKGYFWSPTVLSDVPDSARVMREEPFGPIAPFVRFARLDDAIRRANDVEFGLAGYAFTNSLRSARAVQEGLKVGMVGINTFGVTAPEMPFAGIKNSGLGVAQGVEGLLDHMNVKSLYRSDL